MGGEKRRENLLKILQESESAVSGTKLIIADVEFIETDNDGQINVTMQNGTTWVVPITMTLVFIGSHIVIG